MAERPILFSAPMVRALLAGTKTQTRRVVKGMALEWLRPNGFTPEFTAAPENGLCPYGNPGDRLWVKETWRPRISHGCSMDACDCDSVHVTYAADGERSEGRYFTGYQIPDSWSMPKASKRGNVSPLFMPRWASRLALEITGVRVERLDSISDADCRAEGCPGGHGSIPNYPYSATPREHYRHVWESIDGAGSWDANPWVWVIEFKRVTP